MLKISLKHLLQVLLVPLSVMITVWTIYVLTAWLPDTQVSHWIAAGVLLAVLSELILWRIENKAVIIALVFLCAVLSIAVPIWALNTFRGYVDVIIAWQLYIMGLGGLFAFTLPWRIFNAGYSILDIQEATGNLPKGSLSKHYGIEKD